MKRIPAPGTPHIDAGPSGHKELLSETVEMLHRVFQAVDLFSRQTLRDFGVSGPQIWALRSIDQAGVSSMGGLRRACTSI